MAGLAAAGGSREPGARSGEPRAESRDPGAGRQEPGGGSPARLDAARRAASALQLAAQEYRLAFRSGVLVERGEAEEAALFVAAARRESASLEGRAAGAFAGRSAGVASLVARGAPADSVASRVAEAVRLFAADLGTTLEERPGRAPSAAAGARAYATRCAQCHGARGLGDGPAGRGLTPPPAALADPARMATLTPLDVYRRLTLGVPGTAMPAFGGVLAPEERWDLALHVAGLSVPSFAAVPSGADVLVLATVRATLRRALDLARGGDGRSGAAQTLDAYMAFEAIEPALRARRPALVADAEREFTAFRLAAAGAGGVGTGAGPASADLLARHARLERLLDQAANALAERPSASALFAESFLLLLREGLEAILILGAIVAVVAKAGAQERQREVRWGAGLAVVASFVTAALLRWMLRVAPARQEALEGVVLLLAATVLFYVSYWLVSKLDVAAWQRFVEQRVHGALAGGGAFALAAAAFLAVYREGFETVLFYQALYGTGGAAGAAPITAGLVLGGAALVAVFVAIERFGVRVPLRPFFAGTGALLYFMAFVFAGRGMTELQEGGWVGATPVRGGPRLEFLGIHPTVESLAAQGVLVLALLVAGVVLLRRRPRWSGGGVLMTVKRQG